MTDRHYHKYTDGAQILIWGCGFICCIPSTAVICLLILAFQIESIIAEKIMTCQCNLQQSKKLASTLALLPCVRVSQNSLSLMIRKILIVVNCLLNDTFLGLDGGYTGHETMLLLIPPGSKSPPPLGGKPTYGDGHIHPTNKFCVSKVQTISALIHCCSVMLTSYYPIQVNIPVPALVTLIQRVLLTDVSLHKSLLQSLHQELICSEIPTLHSTFLDLLCATIKGIHSSLLPHAGSVVILIVEYFKRAKVPAVRIKLYTVVRLLLSSMGVGIAMHLLDDIVHNIFVDLDDNSGLNLFMLSTDHPMGATSSSSKSFSQRSHIQQGQTSACVSSEPTCSTKSMAPICVKTSALETMEVLLNVGGLFRASYWRTKIEQLLINVARDSVYKVRMHEQTPSLTEDTSVLDFQLASLRALLACFLSHRECPPYLAQGLELFNRGKLETGTELAKFCSHALLALDVLVHSRGLHLQYDSKFHLQRAPHGDGGSMFVAREESVLDPGRSEHPCSLRKRRATEDPGDEVNDWLLPIDEDPMDALVKDNSEEKLAAMDMSRDPMVQKDTINREHQDIVSYRFPDEVQDVPTSSRTNVELAIAATKSGDSSAEFDTLGYPCSVNVGSAPISIAPSVPQNHEDDPVSSQNGEQKGGIISGVASGSQNVAGQTSPIFGASGAFGSDWDSLDPFLDIGNLGTDTNVSLNMANLDPESD